MLLSCRLAVVAVMAVCVAFPGCVPESIPISTPVSVKLTGSTSVGTGASDTGVADGYVYVPPIAGTAGLGYRQNGPAALISEDDTPPEGYAPFVGAMVSGGGFWTVSGAGGYFAIYGLSSGEQYTVSVTFPAGSGYADEHPSATITADGSALVRQRVDFSEIPALTDSSGRIKFTGLDSISFSFYVMNNGAAPATLGTWVSTDPALTLETVGTAPALLTTPPIDPGDVHDVDEAPDDLTEVRQILNDALRATNGGSVFYVYWLVDPADAELTVGAVRLEATAYASVAIG